MAGGYGRVPMATYLDAIVARHRTEAADDARSTDELVEVMGRDKKVLGDGLTFVLDGPHGVEVVDGIDPGLVRTVLERVR